jgi:hypothetical protein
LDNNLVERALKRAVLHRKNALFYRTLNGAQVGDLFMSLIHTCQLCGANSFDYLIELQRHAQELAASPTEWMPWNYRETLARTMPHPDSAWSYDESRMAGKDSHRPGAGSFMKRPLNRLRQRANREGFLVTAPHGPGLQLAPVCRAENSAHDQQTLVLQKSARRKHVGITVFRRTALS